MGSSGFEGVLGAARGARVLLDAAAQQALDWCIGASALYAEGAVAVGGLGAGADCGEAVVAVAGGDGDAVLRWLGEGAPPPGARLFLSARAWARCAPALGGGVTVEPFEPPLPSVTPPPPPPWPPPPP